jgi:hypothetical protein
MTVNGPGVTSRKVRYGSRDYQGHTKKCRLRHIHVKKSGAVRPGGRGGHGTSPKREITGCGNKRRNYSRVGRCTILLKAQGTAVWWKIRGQKFTDRLCVTLRRGCVRADRLGLRLTDANTRAMLSGVRTEDGRPGGFYT